MYFKPMLCGHQFAFTESEQKAYDEMCVENRYTDRPKIYVN